MSVKKGTIQVSTENIFPVIRQWLYTDKDIFLRELVSNAADAITKLERLRSLGEWDHPEKPEYEIEVAFDKEAGTITISDNGIGMSLEEIDQYINNIAYSGAMAFIEKYQDKGDSQAGVIGHFGLGFYSSFMVSDSVQIDSLSWQEGATPAFWTSDSGMDYEMGDGNKETRGTSITMHLNAEAKAELNAYTLESTLKKYCQFMPYPIYFRDIEEEKKQALEAKEKKEDGETVEEAEEASTKASEKRAINNTNPLWQKDPKSISDEEYIKFYHETFMDFRDPLFWIHLNMDYPFRLQGILYFPREEERLDTLDGRIKIYYNQVFVADNVKEIIPDFLFLLRGTIDSPDLPLNVSRSNLQNDSNLQRLSGHIVRKVADKLKELAKNNREDYEAYWEDISLFTRYGAIRDQKFYDRVKDALLFEGVNGSMNSFEELKKMKEEGQEKFYYTSDKKAQIAYINRLQNDNKEVYVMEHELDIPFMQKLEMDDQLKFIRVDAEVSGEEGNQARREQLEKIFRRATANDKLKLDVKALGIDGESAILTEDEHARQMRDMRKMYEQMEGMKMEDLEQMFPEDRTLVINTDQSVITKLCILDETSGKEEETDKLAMMIYDLARLSHGSLESEDLFAFLQRANQILASTEL